VSWMKLRSFIRPSVVAWILPTSLF
jgi:hypothetical protein